MRFKSGKGGARRGAGRPRGTGKRIVSDNDIRLRLGLRLPAYILRWVRRQDITPGRLIEIALLKSFKDEIVEGRRYDK